MPTKDPEKRKLANRRYYENHKGQQTEEDHNMLDVNYW